MPSPAISVDSLLLDVLLADDGLYDRFVAYSPTFKKLARVLMREDVAGELLLADVASMVGVPAAALVAIAGGALLPSVEPAADPADPPTPPAWLDELPDHLREIRRLDVRPLLEDGQEPLPEILRVVGTVRPGDILALDATFHPVPLRRLLGGRGFASYAEMPAAGHWRVFFHRAPASGCSCGH